MLGQLPAVTIQTCCRCAGLGVGGQKEAITCTLAADVRAAEKVPRLPSHAAQLESPLCQWRSLTQKARLLLGGVTGTAASAIRVIGKRVNRRLGWRGPPPPSSWRQQKEEQKKKKNRHHHQLLLSLFLSFSRPPPPWPDVHLFVQLPHCWLYVSSGKWSR